MSFLTPLFLLGLAALAVPVLIHLTQRERKSVVEFPSLMFLRKIPYESVQRRRIRDWLLLALRLGGDRADRRRRSRGRSCAARISRPRPAARATLSCCSIAPTAWATPIRGRARSARRRQAIESATPADRISRGAVCRHRGSRAAIDAGSLARGRGDQRRDARARIDEVRPGAEARRQPARRIAAAAQGSDSSSRTSSAADGSPTTRCACRAARRSPPRSVEGAQGASLALTPVALLRIARGRAARARHRDRRRAQSHGDRRPPTSRSISRSTAASCRT